jgi:DNA-binding GntR family transcriptional regulator
LVARDKGWGYVVRAITFKEILELFKLRESLEVQAALEALPHLNAELLERMEKVCDEAERLLKEKKLIEFRATNRQFHSLIAVATENDLLQRLLRMINDRIRLVGAMHLDVRRQRPQEALAENRMILEALRSRRGERVKHAVLAHIEKSRNGLLQAAAGPHLAEVIKNVKAAPL